MNPRYVSDNYAYMAKAIEMADYFRVIRAWGGVKLYISMHAKRRATERVYEFYNYDLLSSTIEEILSRAGEPLEEALMDLRLGESFVVLDDKTSMFLAFCIGFDERLGMPSLLLKTVIDRKSVKRIYASENTAVAFKISEGGEVLEASSDDVIIKTKDMPIYRSYLRKTRTWRCKDLQP